MKYKEGSNNKRERNSATSVRTHFLQCRSSVRKP